MIVDDVFRSFDGMTFNQCMTYMVKAILMFGTGEDRMQQIIQAVHLMGRGDKDILLGRMIKYYTNAYYAKLN